jgi:hypothetical protein
MLFEGGDGESAPRSAVSVAAASTNAKAAKTYEG